VDCGFYFGSFKIADTDLLIATASQILCFGPNGEMKWASAQLGIDGVLIEDLKNGVISGTGEWDPPGGWKPFRISIETGQP